MLETIQKSNESTSCHRDQVQNFSLSLPNPVTVSDFQIMITFNDENRLFYTFLQAITFAIFFV